jgi:hypothetical protein
MSVERKFRRRLQEIRAQYDPQIDKSLEENDSEKSEKLQVEMHARLDDWQLRWEDWESSDLINNAMSFDLDESLHSDESIWQKVGKYRVLTPKARLKIRKALTSAEAVVGAKDELILDCDPPRAYAPTLASASRLIACDCRRSCIRLRDCTCATTKAMRNVILVGSWF